MLKTSLCLFVLCGLGISPLLGAEPPRAEDRIASFSLKDTTRKNVTLADFRDKAAIVVVFVGTECPLANQYMARLKELHAEYAARGVQFLAVYSNSQDSVEKIAAHPRKHELPFPALRDGDQHVADQFRAERTPTAYLLDNRGRVHYRGRIDDQYGIGVHRPQPTRRDLADALDDVLAGRPVRQPRTEVVGCFIGRSRPAPEAGAVTYTKHVAAILQKSCQECHRPGQIGPFALMTYAQARDWSETIREVVTERRMPPWHADQRHGKFANDRSLSEKDRATLLAWIDQGCPKGDDRDLPPARTFSDEWAIGKPDVVLSMPKEFRIPAQAPTGGIPYQYYRVPTGFTEDVWVQAAEARPGNRAVVHHIIVFVGNMTESPRDGVNDLNALVTYVPGSGPAVFPAGTAKRIPKGTPLVLQVHYTANGTEQMDLSSVGLVLAKEPPRHQVHTRYVLNMKFAIPPGAANHPVTASATFDREAVLLTFLPHMHYRGKSFQYRAVYPDGRSEILLSVPRYDFHWQTIYRLAEPRRLPAGTRIECMAVFDNSANNPNNPDPTKEVRWGEQSWEEMMAGRMEFYYPGEARAQAGNGR